MGLSGDPRHVCDDDFAQEDADVACRGMGYAEGFTATYSVEQNVPTSDFIMDDVACNQILV